MANFQLNQLVKKGQFRTFSAVITAVIVMLLVLMTLLQDSAPKKTLSVKKEFDLTGIVDESFTEANTESAMTMQQTEVDGLKKEMGAVHSKLKNMMEAHEAQVVALNKTWQEKLEELEAKRLMEAAQLSEANGTNGNGLHPQMLAMNDHTSGMGRAMSPSIHMVSFRKKRHFGTTSRLNPAHYVPSNTSVRAIVLGGADADASVNGQSKNNGVMLFKFLEDGTLPNGQRSRLRGCRVSANSYGDISSERAFATLYRLSCAHPGEAIIDKEITGWVFFNGKVGIKGKPLMRDGKVMTWAGISGALSGVAQAAQYAQSIQQFGAYGATSLVPSSNIGPFAAYGGASKAADKLSEYYVKRAEQYHPVIQVGSGNVVTVVFKDGFYLEPDEETKRYASNGSHNTEERFDEAHNDSLGQFNVPPEVLNHIDKTYQVASKPQDTFSGDNQ
jgi:conjugal transfer pilus assembly protein TraB